MDNPSFTTVVGTRIFTVAVKVRGSSREVIAEAEREVYRRLQRALPSYRMTLPSGCTVEIISANVKACPFATDVARNQR